MSPTVTQRRSKWTKTGANGRGDGGPRRAAARRGRALLGGRAGRRARRRGPRSPQGRTPNGRRPPTGADPGRPARGAGQHARAGARADPLRPDARLAVHLLPRRRVPDGGRPRRRRRAPGSTCSSAATRTCRTSACSPRPTGGWSSTSTTSTRRCRARSSGTSSGSSASFAVAGRDRGFDAKHSARRSISRPPRAYREAMRDVRRDADARRLVRADRRRRALVEQRRRGEATKAAQAVRARTSPRRAQGQPAGVRQAHRVVDGEPRIIERPAADRRRSRTSPADGAPSSSTSAAHGVIRSYRRTLPATAGACSSATATSHAARKVVGVGSVGTRAWIVPAARPRRRRPAVPAGQGGAAVGARAVPRPQRVRQPRPAGRRGPAADAGGERHHARLDHARRASTASSATSTSASCGTRRARRSIETMEPRRMAALRAVCGWTLARAHARAGDARRDRRATSATATRSTARWREFAEAYADQNERTTRPSTWRPTAGHRVSVVDRAVTIVHIGR